MALTWISREEIKNVLTYERLIPEMETALAQFSNGSVVQPVRTIVPVSKVNGFLGVMPAYSQEQGALATKLVTFFPNNKDVPTHNAIIVMFNPDSGVPELLMDGDVITTMRTAAVSAVATKLFCGDDPQVLAILGSGVQARSHFHALTSLFSFKKINVWSKTLSNAQKLADEINGTAYDSAEMAVRDADVIVTVTSSSVPVLKKDWVKPGAHINAVGACRPDWQEIDPALMTSAVVFVDSRTAACQESGDVILSGAEVYAELGEVINNVKDKPKGETTLFKSLGR
ncbi:Thiomorpholine-carboxylate dehydrogenase [Mizuhopecten yessoensis]|uniref:Ketimine reductase mu-crystallin n=1 Tax=Mizuhopecten yessoensis TaxID=6573 RepID=A0A210QCP0_MIZYE|nr:Thiomorpholine-carboxylate dehydrogenase [Mizuhopecten yessoensis]